MAGNSVLDAKDMKVMELVTEDGRLSLNTVASKVRLSREAVAYRIKRLQELNILRNCVAKIDMTRFYQCSYYVLFRFRKTSPDLHRQRIEALAASPYVMWVGSLSGEYDIAASFLTRDTSDLLDFVRYLENLFTDLNYELMIYTREFKNSHKDIFRTSKGLPEPADGFMMRSFAKSKILAPDDIDMIILYALSKNANITNAELGGMTGLSAEAVRQRIKQLEHSGLITGYRYLINIYNMNMEVYAVYLRFENLTQQKEDELRMYIQTLPNVYYSARLIGKYNVQIGLTARDRFHFQDIVDEIRNRFSESISICHTHIVFGENKHTYFPPACCKHIKGFDSIENEFESKYAFKYDTREGKG